MDDSFIERDQERGNSESGYKMNFRWEGADLRAAHSPAFDNDFPDEEMREKLEEGTRIFAARVRGKRGLVKCLAAVWSSSCLVKPDHLLAIRRFHPFSRENDRVIGRRGAIS